MAPLTIIIKLTGSKKNRGKVKNSLQKEHFDAWQEIGSPSAKQEGGMKYF